MYGNKIKRQKMVYTFCLHILSVRCGALSFACLAFYVFLLCLCAASSFIQQSDRVYICKPPISSYSDRTKIRCCHINVIELKFNCQIWGRSIGYRYGECHLSFSQTAFWVCALAYSMCSYLIIEIYFDHIQVQQHRSYNNRPAEESMRFVL